MNAKKKKSTRNKTSRFEANIGLDQAGIRARQVG